MLNYFLQCCISFVWANTFLDKITVQYNNIIFHLINNNLTFDWANSGILSITDIPLQKKVED